MGIIVVIAVVFLIGVYFLLRSPAPNAAQAPSLGADEAKQLRDAVLQKLQERLVGWTYEASASEPLEIVAFEEATQRRIVLNLTQLSEAWSRAHTAGDQDEADAYVEAYVQAATGEGKGEEASNLEWMRAALALQLLPAAKLPRAAIARDVGALKVVLVLRNPNGPEAVSREELSSWELAESAAFELAFENLRQEVEDGLTLDPLDEEMNAARIAPGDPLASAFALVPELGVAMQKKLGGEVHFHVGERELIVTKTGANASVGARMVDVPVVAGELKWQATK